MLLEGGVDPARKLKHDGQLTTAVKVAAMYGQVDVAALIRKAMAKPLTDEVRKQWQEKQRRLAARQASPTSCL